MNNNQYNTKFHVKQEKTTSKYCKIEPNNLISGQKTRNENKISKNNGDNRI